MDPDYTHGLNGSPYGDDNRNRRSWGENNPYSTAPYPAADYAATQLPPIQTDRNTHNSTPTTTYDPVRRPQQLPTTMGQSFPPYTSQPPQSPYGVPHYQNSPHLGAQFTPQMSPLAQHFPASTYSPIRPMPALAPSQPHPLQGAYGANYQFPQAEEGEPQQRLHVVGSQGRRGVLPSDEGRPPAISNGATGTKSTLIPQKDADGKFPCPHCTKTYLHGKHLKRHLLRHTGDRPYSCFLCNDTFSRSDILKRHFQKCSQRRGNPTGASHLAYSQNHIKRQAAKAKQEQQRAAQAAAAAAQGTLATTEAGVPAVTQPSIGTATNAFTDSNAGMSTVNAVQHHPADISIKPYGDTRSGAIPSPGLKGPSHNFLAGQSASGSLPSSGSSTPLTARSNGQFPQTFDTNVNRPYPDMSQRNNLSQLPGNLKFENNEFEWSGYNQGKDSSGSIPSCG